MTLSVSLLTHKGWKPLDQPSHWSTPFLYLSTMKTIPEPWNLASGGNMVSELWSNLWGQAAVLSIHIPSLLLGEGNGTPFQYSCLENSVVRGAWWAAVHGVAQSRTWLKWLSMHACIGEGNGNTLQYSCLENPRDRGAWWAAIYGVTQSQTWLKQLSSSSSSLLLFPFPQFFTIYIYSFSNPIFLICHRLSYPFLNIKKQKSFRKNFLKVLFSYMVYLHTSIPSVTENEMSRLLPKASLTSHIFHSQSALLFPALEPLPLSWILPSACDSGLFLVKKQALSPASTSLEQSL